MTMIQDETRLRRMLDAAIAAASPASAIAAASAASAGRADPSVLGAGKAAAAMAQEVEQHMAGPVSGLVVTRYGHAVPCRAHRGGRGRPPGAGCGRQRGGARACCELAEAAGAGGLGAVPDLRRRLRAARFAGAWGISLDDKQALNRALLRLGRRHRPDEHGAQAPLGDQGRQARGARRIRPSWPPW